jgi:hypothetical protein
VNAAPATPAAPTLAVTQPTCAVATGTITITSPTAGLTFSVNGGAYAAYPAGGYTGLAAGPIPSLLRMLQVVFLQMPMLQ